MPTVSRGLYNWFFRRGATLEDFTDRLNHFWTFGLLLLLACIVSWKQGYSSPISCWTPAQFTGSIAAYTHQHCWNSYFIQYPRDIENAYEKLLKMNYSLDDDDISDVTYESKIITVSSEKVLESDSLLKKMSTTRTLYQWIPIILCFQALLFKLPNILMYILHSFTGITFDKISGLTCGYENMTLQERDYLSRKIGRYIYNWCRQFENCLPWRFLTLIWLIVKFLYCVNIIVQMCVMDAFLRTKDPPLDNSTSYGDVINSNLFKNNASLWKTSPAFPKAVMCDLNIRQLKNIQRFKIQCDLPMNYFNEYVYMFIWVWFLFVAIVTCVSFLVWLSKTLMPISRKRYISKALNLDEDNEASIRHHDLGKFCDLVGEDGIMVLKLTSANSSDLLIADIVSNMWRMRSKYTQQQQQHGYSQLQQQQQQHGGQVLSAPGAHTQSSMPAIISAGYQPSIPAISNAGYMRVEMQEMDNGPKKVN